MQTPGLRGEEPLIPGPVNLFMMSPTALSAMPCSVELLNAMLALARRRRYDCIPDQNLAIWAICLFVSFINQTINPSQFSVGLKERLVLSMSNEDDWVLGPFMGARTAVVAALSHERHGAGAETAAKSVELACRRIEQEMAGTLRTSPISQAR